MRAAKPYPRETLEREVLATRAELVLRKNDMGGWTKAAPDLYPHQWSWDSAFIAVGLAHLDTARAARELLTIFAHQWKTGKVPHIVFNPQAPPGSYFPGAEHWACAAASPDAPPAPPYTSCLCQPPVHSIAALRIWEVAELRGEKAVVEAQDFLREIYPRLLLWHRYLLTYRDPEESGLVTIYHPWESGTDNSPRWDAALEAVEVGELPRFERQDLDHVDDPSERPTDADYDRYLWLVKLVKRATCDEAAIYRSHPFLVKDVLFSAILAAANEALLEISRLVGASREDAELISSWISRGRRGLQNCWDPEVRLCLDYDLRAAEPLRSRTVAGFAPLVAGGLRPRRLASLLETLRSPSFLGYPRLRRPLPPSTSPEDPGFSPRSYWRGPVWPVIDWLLWWALERAQEYRLAERVRESSLEQIAEGGFAEYFEPFTGEPLGSREQSWTAAVVLDWLASGPQRELRAA
jgi:glucosylglycerate hydrolase